MMRTSDEVRCTMRQLTQAAQQEYADEKKQ